LSPRIVGGFFTVVHFSTIVNNLTTQPAQAPVLNDRTWVRDRIRPIREELQQLIREITWDDCLGDCCTQLQRAELCLLAARESSHRWEGIPHPAHITTEATEITDACL